jgi:UDP-2-acetamido-3-amino-2,3-dideoxy-glucuronate N-acetyltransferase
MFQSVAGLSTVRFPIIRDDRGALVSFELDKMIPFKVARVFWIFDVPACKLRAGHAHKECHQFIVCSCGDVSIEISDGGESRTHALEAGTAIHIPPAIFVTLQFNRPGSVVTVFCDKPYEESEYIRDLAALKAIRLAGSATK